MAVYVDDARVERVVTRGGRTCSGTWSRMVADSLTELLVLGRRIGMMKEWLDVAPSGVGFDITESKRARALRAGAIELPTGSPAWEAVMTASRQQYRDMAPAPAGGSR